MNTLTLFATIASLLVCQTAKSQTCEGGAYLNPQLFRGEAAHQIAVAEQEMNSFISRTGLPPAPLYTIKRTDDVTASGRRSPYCWIYSNSFVGLSSGYKPVVVNSEVIRPAVVALSQAAAGSKPFQRAVPLKALPPAEQQQIVEKMQRSRCFGTAASVEANIVRTEGLCAVLEDVAAERSVGQQGLIARAVFEWDEQAWLGVVAREDSGLLVTTSGLAGKSERVHLAKLVVIPTKNTSFGFGLYVHPSVPDAVVRKAASAFQSISSPSKPLAIALDLGSSFSFIVPTAEQVTTMRAALGIR